MRGDDFLPEGADNRAAPLGSAADQADIEGAGHLGRQKFAKPAIRDPFGRHMAGKIADIDARQHQVDQALDEGCAPLDVEPGIGFQRDIGFLVGPADIGALPQVGRSDLALCAVEQRVPPAAEQAIDTPGK